MKPGEGRADARRDVLRVRSLHSGRRADPYFVSIGKTYHFVSFRACRNALSEIEKTACDRYALRYHQQQILNKAEITAKTNHTKCRLPCGGDV
jgi:hypothetical protein